MSFSMQKKVTKSKQIVRKPPKRATSFSMTRMMTRMKKRISKNGTVKPPGTMKVRTPRMSRMRALLIWNS